MDINKIEIQIDGYVMCKSSFYTVYDVIDDRKFEFHTGLNLLEGDIDSGAFGVSYLIPMYKKAIQEAVFLPSEPLVNGQSMTLSEISKFSCYLDQSYGLFSSRKTVRNLVEHGLRKSKLPYSSDDICRMFEMSDFRFERRISGTGNERYKAMAAIGFSYGRQVFCFPWFSRMRYGAFNLHMPSLLNTLTDLKKIVILPLGK